MENNLYTFKAPVTSIQQVHDQLYLGIMGTLSPQLQVAPERRMLKFFISKYQLEPPKKEEMQHFLVQQMRGVGDGK